MFDSHIHTKFSPDSKEEITAVIQEVEKQGLGAIITEHLDFDDPYADYKLLDLKGYFKEYSSYRSSKLLIGVELGMRLDRLEESKRIIEEHPFDYVIGSIHFVNGKDLFDSSFYKGRSKIESYTEYLSYMVNCAKVFDFVDSLGHIDYICRYSTYEDQGLRLEEFGDLIDELFKTLIEKDKALEINTRRLKHKEAVEELLNIYSRFYALGGRYVTIGSDAHFSYKVGANFREAIAIAEQCKLKPVYFKNRKLNYI